MRCFNIFIFLILGNNQNIFAPKINDKFQKLLEKKVDINDIYGKNNIMALIELMDQIIIIIYIIIKFIYRIQ